MTNNTNVNLAGKLFAYVQHGVDISANIKEKYNSSLIFIGDEQQIYVPAKNTYVGVGMSNFNAALTRISDLQNELNELKNTTRSSVVQKIYPQWGPDDYLINGEHRAGVNSADSLGYLTGAIEITALGDYDVTTHWAYQYYQHPNADGTFSQVNSAGNFVWHSENTPATSGIRISYEAVFTQETDANTGLTYIQPGKQRLIIDDTQTWAYMTSAYSYTLDFSRDYTNLQVETLYHDLLGIGEDILIPVSNDSMWKINPQTGVREYIGGTFFEWDDASEPVMPISMKDNGVYTEDTSKWTLPAGKTNHWVKITSTNVSGETPAYHDGREHFKKSTDYNSTYNMDISNGIQTLKEVAYILDQLSDGGLGTVTYLTKAEWNADDGLNFDSTVEGHHTQVGNTYTISGTGEYHGTYYRVYTNGNPTTNSSKYGYWINTGNPENLGIQIAYSIAGNTADIQDLHEHVALAEQGITTLRSLSAQSTNMMTVSSFTAQQFQQTDTEEHLPTTTATESTYNVGDVKMVFGLNLASTYITTTTAATTAASVTYTANGEQYWGGVYQPVNMSDVAGKPVPADTYYRIENDTFTAVSATTGNAVADQINVLMANGEQWYTIGDSKSRNFINDSFELLDNVAFANLASAEQLYTKQVVAGQDVYTAANTAGNTTFAEDTYYIRTSTGAANIIHAVTTMADNKIATTAWTIALVDDKNKAIEKNMNDIKKLAYMYTDAKIAALDWTMGYEDFNWDNAIRMQMCSTLPGTGDRAAWMAGEGFTYFVDGSDAYNEAYAAARNEWLTYIGNVASGQGREDQDRFTTSYLANKIRSQYISNIQEVDGIVKVTGTTELPTDMVEIHTEVWGNQDSSSSKEFVQIDITAVSNAVPGLVDGSNFEKLFYIANSSADHAIYYCPGGDDNKTYQKVADTTAGHNIQTDSDAYYVYNAETCEYTQASQENKIAWQRNKVDNGKHVSPYYTQLYTKVDAYYEVDLSTVTQANGDLTSFYYGKYDEYGHMTQETVMTDIYTKLYTVSKTGTASAKYITGTIQHYDFTTYGGEGQNKLSLTTHITYLEDATPNNTGLVDAYDVVSFMDNLFEWVDLSATIDANAINTRDIFYQKYEFTLGKPTAQVDGTPTITGTLYKKPATAGNNYISVTNPEYKVFGKSATNNDEYVVFNNSSEVMVPGSQFYSFYDENGPIDLYVRTQETYTNVLNLQITKYGETE